DAPSEGPPSPYNSQSTRIIRFNREVSLNRPDPKNLGFKFLSRRVLVLLPSMSKSEAASLVTGHARAGERTDAAVEPSSDGSAYLPAGTGAMRKWRMANESNRHSRHGTHLRGMAQ